MTSIPCGIDRHPPQLPAERPGHPHRIEREVKDRTRSTGTVAKRDMAAAGDVRLRSQVPAAEGEVNNMSKRDMAVPGDLRLGGEVAAAVGQVNNGVSCRGQSAEDARPPRRFTRLRGAVSAGRTVLGRHGRSVRGRRRAAWLAADRQKRRQTQPPVGGHAGGGKKQTQPPVSARPRGRCGREWGDAAPPATRGAIPSPWRRPRRCHAGGRKPPQPPESGRARRSSAREWGGAAPPTRAVRLQLHGRAPGSA